MAEQSKRGEATEWEIEQLETLTSLLTQALRANLFFAARCHSEALSGLLDRVTERLLDEKFTVESVKGESVNFADVMRKKMQETFNDVVNRQAKLLLHEYFGVNYSDLTVENRRLHAGLKDQLYKELT
jgi:hypothetical protein